MCVCIAILGVIVGHKLFIVTLSRFVDFVVVILFFIPYHLSLFIYYRLP